VQLPGWLLSHSTHVRVMSHLGCITGQILCVCVISGINKLTGMLNNQTSWPLLFCRCHNPVAALADNSVHQKGLYTACRI
jgi:hypothetical protein